VDIAQGWGEAGRHGRWTDRQTRACDSVHDVQEAVEGHGDDVRGRAVVEVRDEQWRHELAVRTEGERAYIRAVLAAQRVDVARRRAHHHLQLPVAVGVAQRGALVFGDPAWRPSLK
jgi:hypothetical protein